MDADGTSGVCEARSSSTATDDWPNSKQRETKRPSLAEHFAQSRRSAVDDQDQHQQQPQHERSDTMKRGTRSLVGGTFPVPDTCENEDTVSVDSASLIGASFVASLGDQSVTTRSSLFMEYSEDERSERGSRSVAPLTTSSLGHARIAAESPRRSLFFVERELDADTESVLTSSTDQASTSADDMTSSDAYFSRHLITPPQSMLGKRRPQNGSDGDDEDDDDYLESNLEILDSSDTDHVYEDEDESSNNYTEEPHHETDDESTIEGSQDCSSKNNQLEEKVKAESTMQTKTATTASLDWSTYNQERGRFLAQRLISKARQQCHPDCTVSPHTPSTLASAADATSPDDDDDDDDEDAVRRHALLMFRNPFLRRRRHQSHGSSTAQKRLDQAYLIIDATVRDEPQVTIQTNADAAAGAAEQEATFSPSSSRSSPNEKGLVLQKSDSRASSLSDSLMDDDDDNDNDDNDANDDLEGSWNPEWSTSFRRPLPQGLTRRATVEDIIDELGLGSQGYAAIQQLRRELQQEQQQHCCCEPTCSFAASASCMDPTSTVPSCTISIQGILIPNYAARIQWSLSYYRRTELDLSDEMYAAMMVTGT